MRVSDIGYFATDPVIKQVDGTNCCEFVLGIKERLRKDGETRELRHYFDFVVWDKAADLIYKWKKKGDLIYFQAVARKEYIEGGDSRNAKVIFRITDFEFISSGRKSNISENDET